MQWPCGVEGHAEVKSPAPANQGATDAMAKRTSAHTEAGKRFVRFCKGTAAARRRVQNMNYYKITNEEEIHNRMHYKTGLNIDVLPFNPSGDYEKGGIYFSREDILASLNYGTWIRKVTLPEDAQIYENPGTPKKWKADKVILGEREKINAKKIKQLIKEGADPKADDSGALLWAAKNGHTKIVKLLIPLSDPKACDSYALRMAAKNGHTEIVKLLIPVSDPKIVKKVLKKKIGRFEKGV